MLSKKELYKKYIIQDKSTREIAKEQKCSHATISAWLRKHGIHPKGRRGQKIIGKEYGNLTVIGKSKQKGKWVCKCSCGNIKDLLRNNFDGGKTKSCGCVKKSMYADNSKHWKGHGQISGYVWSGIKHSASKRNIDFNLTIKEANDILENQNNVCSISGLKIDLPVSVEKTCELYSSNWSASLDRICSSRGYEKENVHWVHKDINKMKWTFDLDYFINICSNICCNNEFEEIEIRDCSDCKRSHLFTGHKCIYGKDWHDIKRDAKRREIPFDLTIEQAWSVYEKQKGRCSISKVPISFRKSWNDSKSRTASLDRIDSGKPYICNNVQWVHKDVNMCKGSLELGRFLDLCQAVYSQSTKTS